MTAPANGFENEKIPLATQEALNPTSAAFLLIYEITWNVYSYANVCAGKIIYYCHSPQKYGYREEWNGISTCYPWPGLGLGEHRGLLAFLDKMSSPAQRLCSYAHRTVTDSYRHSCVWRHAYTCSVWSSLTSSFQSMWNCLGAHRGGHTHSLQVVVWPQSQMANETLRVTPQG